MELEYTAQLLMLNDPAGLCQQTYYHSQTTEQQQQNSLTIEVNEMDGDGKQKAMGLQLQFPSTPISIIKSFKLQTF